MTRPRLAAALATTLAVAGLAVPGALSSAQATAPPKGPKVTDGCVASVPEPGAEVRTDICYTLFKPAGATKKRKVPMIMHSHGWGGSRTKDPAAFARWLDAGFGVLSVLDRAKDEPFGVAQLDLLSRFSTQAAIGLDLLLSARRAQSALGGEGTGSVVARVAALLDDEDDDAGRALLEAIERVLASRRG